LSPLRVAVSHREERTGGASAARVYERQAMEAMGLQFTLALSTSEALQTLSARRFAAIISDMGPKGGPREAMRDRAHLRDRYKGAASRNLNPSGEGLIVAYPPYLLSRGAPGKERRN
jgi:hypothetical protein